MRALLMACAACTALLIPGAALPPAIAMPRAPVEARRLIEPVQAFCPEVWRCSRFACGWTFVCDWPRAYAYGPTITVRPYRAWRRWSYRRYR